MVIDIELLKEYKTADNDELVASYNRLVTIAKCRKRIKDDTLLYVTNELVHRGIIEMPNSRKLKDFQNKLSWLEIENMYEED